MSNVWTIGQMVGWATQYLERQGSQSPRLDTQVLLGHVCNMDKVQLYVQFDRPLQPSELASFKALLQRRSNDEPVAYILGEKEFYGRSFAVTPHVLVPRPETEHLVDAVIAHVQAGKIESPRIVDVGTGSGCVAITLALELEDAMVVSIDVCKNALAQAAVNAETLDVRDRVRFTSGDVLDPIQTQSSVDVVVSNPPYLDAALMATLPPDVEKHEPIKALSGGDDGLVIIRGLVSDAIRVLKPGGLLALEVAGDQQAQQVVSLCDQSQGYEGVQVIPDYQQIPRIVTAIRKSENDD